MQRSELVALIREVGLGHREEFLLSLAEPSIRLITEKATDVLPLGASRIGGLPDLPIGEEWPAIPSAEVAGENSPLGFLAQINCAEIAPFDINHIFPRSGHLFFFVDPDDYHFTSWRILYYPEGELTRTPIPDHIPERLRFSSYQITPYLEWTLPRLIQHTSDYATYRDYVDVPIWEDVLDYKKRFETLTPEEEDALGDLCMSLWQSTERYFMPDPNRQTHRMLGWANYVQNPMKMFLQTRLLRPDGSQESYGDYSDLIQIEHPATRRLMADAIEMDWTLLLQVDYFTGESNMTWGTLYWFLPKADLLRLDFRNTQFQMQCT